MTVIQLTSEQFEEAVAGAAKRATQEVARRNRWRLVLWGFLTGMAVIAAVAIPTTYVITNESKAGGIAAQRANAKGNCTAISEIAAVEYARLAENRAASERFKRESKDRLGLTERRFTELVREGQRREERQLAVFRHVAARNCRALK